jgi:hypothetical protein
MADTLIATRDNDKLYCEGTATRQDGVTVWYGYIIDENGGKIPVPNIEVLLGHGYWDEIV